MEAAVSIIPSDDGTSVFDVLRSLSTLDRQAIVRPNDPPKGVAGFLFDIPEDEEINLRSLITDHFVEDNTAIADEIALAPEEFSIRGIVAEIASRQPEPTRQKPPQRQALPIEADFAPVPTPGLAQALVGAGSLARILAPGAGQVVGMATALASNPAAIETTIADEATFLGVKLGYGAETARAVSLARVLIAANKSAGRPAARRSNPGANPIPPLTPLVAPALQPDPASLYGMFLDKAAQPPNQTKQARVFAYFYELWKSRTLFTVETPWGVLTNLAILSLRGTQDESLFASTFSITFKKIRTAGSATVSAGQLAGRASYQMAPVTNNGNAGKTPVSATEKQSLLYRMVTVGIPTP